MSDNKAVGDVAFTLLHRHDGKVPCLACEIESLRRALLQVQGERDALKEQIRKLHIRFAHMSED